MIVPQPPRSLVDSVLPDYYDELRAMAGRMLQRERPDHTLQPTALAHEAYLRLARQRSELLQRRAYFMSSAADVIRRVLIDHARQRARAKRGGGWTAVSLEGLLAPARSEVDLLTLDEALTELRDLHERHARVVELRFFGGLELREIANVLGVSLRTVKNDWRTARAWLGRRLSDLDGDARR